MATELVTVSRENQELVNTTSQFRDVLYKLAQMQQQHDVLLELLGDKEEQLEELEVKRLISRIGPDDV
jgi:DNA-binding transcriptional regulator GbsR (MarR family)